MVNKSRNFLMSVLKFILFGLIFGICINTISAQGYFIRWQKLPVENTKGYKLTGLSWGTVIVIDQNNELLACDRFDPICEPPKFFVTKDELINQSLDCDFNSIPFSRLVNTPDSIESCIQDVLLAADSITDTTAVMNESGDIWLWSHHHSGFLSELVPIITIGFFIILGLLLGVLFNVVSIILQKFRGRKNGKAYSS